MFHYLTENTGDVVAIQTTGKLDKDDLHKLLPEIEARIKQHGKVRFYWEMESFDGWSPLSFLQDRVFDVKHAADFKKIAMVGDRKWEQQLAGIMKPFTKAPLKYFNTTEKESAWQWLKED
jgi:SpoIIAA-like